MQGYQKTISQGKICILESRKVGLSKWPYPFFPEHSEDDLLDLHLDTAITVQVDLIRRLSRVFFDGQT